MADPMKPTRTAKDAVAEHRAKLAAKAAPVPVPEAKPAPPVPTPDQPAAAEPKALSKTKLRRAEWYRNSSMHIQRMMAKRDRLPPHSRIESVWTGTEWQITMTIVTFAYASDGHPTGPKVFTQTGSNLFKTLMEADDQYRDWLKSLQPAAAEAKS